MIGCIEQTRSLKKGNKIQNEDIKKGSIEVLKSGNYRFTYMYNKNKFRETIEAKNYSDAERKLVIWVEKIEKGELIASEYTVSEFAQIWIDKQVRPNSSGTRTPNKYINFLNNRFLPHFGNKYIDKITKEEMTEYFNWLKLQKTKFKDREENKYLAPNSIKKFFAILHAMFETAKEWKKISENPCDIKINFKTTGQSASDVSKQDDRVDYFRYKEYLAFLDLLDKEKEDILKKELRPKEKHFRIARIVLFELCIKTRHKTF